MICIRTDLSHSTIGSQSTITEDVQGGAPSESFITIDDDQYVYFFLTTRAETLEDFREGVQGP